MGPQAGALLLRPKSSASSFLPTDFTLSGSGIRLLFILAQVSSNNIRETAHLFSFFIGKGRLLGGLKETALCKHLLRGGRSSPQWAGLWGSRSAASIQWHQGQGLSPGWRGQFMERAQTGGNKIFLWYNFPGNVQRVIWIGFRQSPRLL